jgi:uncharacterized protein with NAD-binding domain and iron-sulfur cluster
VLDARPPGETPAPHAAQRSTRTAQRLLRQAELALTVAIAEAARLLGDAVARTPAPLAPVLLEVLEQVREAFRARIGRDVAGRRTRELADLVLSCLTGVVRDGLMTNPDGFSTIDDLDFTERLAKQGATSETLASPLVRGMYDLVFAFEDGDRSRPRFAAGLGLFLAGKLFSEYRGAIFWQLQAGMGDVVIAPLYQALRARGVRFAFFHRLDRLHLYTDGKGIAAITLGRQARTVADRPYQPLVRVGGLPCFPSRPLAEQLVGPVPVDPESHWSDRDREETVRLVAGTDFDDVVLATSVGMLPHVAGELIDHSPRWRAMCHAVATVPHAGAAALAAGRRAGPGLGAPRRDGQRKHAAVRHLRSDEPSRRAGGLAGGWPTAHRRLLLQRAAVCGGRRPDCRGRCRAGQRGRVPGRPGPPVLARFPLVLALLGQRVLQ